MREANEATTSYFRKAFCFCKYDKNANLGPPALRAL